MKQVRTELIIEVRTYVGDKVISRKQRKSIPNTRAGLAKVDMSLFTHDLLTMFARVFTSVENTGRRRWVERGGTVDNYPDA